MKAFHLDFNGLLFKPSYVKKWLKKLSDYGYDTIIWELENYVKWDTCPTCNDDDAISKEEMRELIKFADDLGLESIPLLQTIGHAEYVFKNGHYREMLENKDNERNYCPSQKETAVFIKKWINEYLDLFPNCKKFHLGADEAYDLGHCENCQKVVKQSSLSALYIQYINQIAESLIEKEIQPTIWSDMILHHLDCLDELNKKIMIFDWIYIVNQSQAKIQVWGIGLQEVHELSENFKKEFGKYLYRQDGKLNIFYSSDYLVEKGFDVVICPASSSYGDNVFTPANFHLNNVFDFVQHSLVNPHKGLCLTSWSVHMMPYEVQDITISILPYLAKHMDANLAQYLEWYAKKFTNHSHQAFIEAFQLAAEVMPFARTQDTGHSKANLNAPQDHVLKQAEKLNFSPDNKELIETIKKRLSQYEKALKQFKAISNVANSEKKEVLDAWVLGTENLLNRAKALMSIINNVDSNETAVIEEKAIELRAKTKMSYDLILQPIRSQKIIHWMYDAFEHYMKCQTKVCN